AGRNSSALGGLQGLYARYFGANGDYVNETTTGLSFSRTSNRPYADLPAASVLLASSDGLGSLSFGGNSTMAASTDAWTRETINQTSFLAGGHASLPVKLYLQSRFDAFDQSLAANRLGRFTYASLADVSANQPSSFSRILNAPSQSGGEWIGAAAVGSTYT